MSGRHVLVWLTFGVALAGLVWIGAGAPWPR